MRNETTTGKDFNGEEDKPAVPPLIEELILRQASDGQSAKNERPRTEGQTLCSLLPFDPDYFDAASALQFLFGDEDVGVLELKYLGGRRHTRRAAAIGRSRK